MLDKLIKYEFKATGRVFLPLYGVILIVALVHRLFGTNTRGMFEQVNQIGYITTTALVALFIALCIMTLVLTVQRFKNNLLGDEGYLMFTLPTTSRKLIMSKFIVALTWVVLSTIVGVVAFLILFIKTNFMKELMLLLGEVQVFKREGISILIQGIAFSFIGYIQLLITIYFSLSIAQLPKLQSHRNLTSIITFILTMISTNWINSFIVRLFISGPSDMSTVLDYMNKSILSSNIVILMISILLFEMTNYILTKHLNLE